MTDRHRRQTGRLTLTAAGLCVAAALGVQAARDAYVPVPASVSGTLYVTSARALGRAALSFDAVLADLYWIRALQHYGSVHLQPVEQRQYPLLKPLLELSVGLDPRFILAYRFGAVFLAEGSPDGPGRPDWALALLAKGLEANPNHWQLAMDTGFVHYWWLHDHRAAAAWFERASRMPGGSWWLKSLAATTLAEGGDWSQSRDLWRRIYETADHDWLRNNARQRLLQFQAVDEIRALNTLITRSGVRGAGGPVTWERLVRLRLLRDIPRDPTGTPYTLDVTQVDAVGLSRESPLAPLPPQFKKVSPVR